MKFGSPCFLPLVFCGLSVVSSAQDVTESYSVLDGNWHLTGAEASKSGQAINLALGMGGNTIYGEGRLPTSCVSADRSSVIAWDIFLEGQIASDGTFILSNRYRMSDVPVRAVSIRGKIPAPGATEWSGSFNISGFSKTSITPAECEGLSGDFVAKQFPPLNGLYEGTVHVDGRDNEAHISLEMAQGRLISTKHTGEFAHVIPLEAKLTVTGSSDLPSNIFESREQPDANNRVGGSSFDLQFLQGNDGTTFRAHGDFDPFDKSRLRVSLFYVSKDESGKLRPVHAHGQLTRP